MRYRLILIILVGLLGLSCTAQNVVHKSPARTEAQPEVRKSDIKDGNAVGAIFHVYSLAIITLVILAGAVGGNPFK